LRAESDRLERGVRARISGASGMPHPPRSSNSEGGSPASEQLPPQMSYVSISRGQRESSLPLSSPNKLDNYE